MTAYTLTRESLNSITDLDMAFGTTKLLPDYAQVPEDFKPESGGNVYTKLLDCMFSGVPLPAGDVVFRKGFDDPDSQQLLVRVIQSHLRSWEPKHEHKIAGLGFLVSLACEITPT